MLYVSARILRTPRREGDLVKDKEIRGWGRCYGVISARLVGISYQMHILENSSKVPGARRPRSCGPVMRYGGVLTRPAALAPTFPPPFVSDGRRKHQGSTVRWDASREIASKDTKIGPLICNTRHTDVTLRFGPRTRQSPKFRRITRPTAMNLGSIGNRSPIFAAR